MGIHPHLSSSVEGARPTAPLKGNNEGDDTTLTPPSPLKGEGEMKRA